MFYKKVGIYIPLLFIPEYERQFSKLDDIISELCNESGKIVIKYKSHALSSLTIEMFYSKDKEIIDLFGEKYKHLPKLRFLKFSSQYPIIDNIVYYGDFEYLFESFIRHFIITLNLAKPGAICPQEGIVKTVDIEDTNTRITNFPPLYNSLQFCLRLCKKYKWPPIKELSILDTFIWIEKQWPAFDTISISRIQRALNAFSYLFHEFYFDTSTSDLFHSMIGIEAIFVDGENNIQDQVNKKTQLLLGKREEFKKVFTDLYNYRSRYIHGQLDFINKFFTDQNSDKPINNILKTHENSIFASAILISAIQKHIESNKSEFEFELVIKK